MAIDKPDKDADGDSAPSAAAPSQAGEESSAPRRKKRGGMRVPSDNVPRPDRQTGQLSTVEPDVDADVVPTVVTIMPAGARPNASAMSGQAMTPPAGIVPVAPSSVMTPPGGVPAPSRMKPVTVNPPVMVPVAPTPSATPPGDEPAAAETAAPAPAVGVVAPAPAEATLSHDDLEVDVEVIDHGGEAIPETSDSSDATVKMSGPSPAVTVMPEAPAFAATLPGPEVPVNGAASPVPASAVHSRAETVQLEMADVEPMEEGEDAAEREFAPVAVPVAGSRPGSGDEGEELAPGEYEEVDSGPVAKAAEVVVAAPEEPPASTSREVRLPPRPPTPPKAPPAPRAAPVAAAAGTPVKGKRRNGKAWYEEIFDEDYLRTLPFLTPQTTQNEANFIADALQLQPGQQVLDLGCGYGRHAMELAARGNHVVGLDLSLPLLIRGADEAQRRGLSINFVHGDMRELTFDAQFDGAYCVFSTFGYFDDETNKRVAQNLARALKPGGRLVLEVLNRDYVIGDLPTRVWWEGDGCVVLEEVDFNYFTSRIASNRSVVFEDGRQLEQEISVRAYSLHELGKLLHAAGFRVLEVSGGLATRGRFFGNESRQIIIVAAKRSDAVGTPAPTSPPPLLK